MAPCFEFVIEPGIVILKALEDLPEFAFRRASPVFSQPGLGVVAIAWTLPEIGGELRGPLAQFLKRLPLEEAGKNNEAILIVVALDGRNLVVSHMTAEAMRGRDTPVRGEKKPAGGMPV